MKYASIFLLILLIGCGTGQQTAPPSEIPEIISMSSLPVRTVSTYGPPIELNVLFNIYEDGTVADIRILGSSGDAEWDKSAIDSMKQWKFSVSSPADFSGTRWFRNTVRVEVMEPVFMNIAEITASSRDEADQWYRQLRRGTDFNDLAHQIRNGTDEEIGIYRGTIDIARYPKHVRDELRKLRICSYTQPIRLGNEYIIFKRFDNQSANNFYHRP